MRPSARPGPISTLLTPQSHVLAGQFPRNHGVAFAARGRASRPLCDGTSEVWQEQAEREAGSSSSPVRRHLGHRKVRNAAQRRAHTRTIGFRPEGLRRTPSPISSACWRGRWCRTKRAKMATRCLHTAVRRAQQLDSLPATRKSPRLFFFSGSAEASPPPPKP